MLGRVSITNFTRILQTILRVQPLQPAAGEGEEEGRGRQSRLCSVGNRGEISPIYLRRPSGGRASHRRCRAACDDSDTDDEGDIGDRGKTEPVVASGRSLSLHFLGESIPRRKTQLSYDGTFINDV